MSLVEKQFLFARCLGKLLAYAEQANIPVTMGECWRSPEQAAWNAKRGIGIAASLHTQRLAVDLLCFRMRVDGSWAWLNAGTEPEYAQLGAVWKAMHPDAAWGGDFTRADPGHYSLAHGGRK